MRDSDQDGADPEYHAVVISTFFGLHVPGACSGGEVDDELLEPGHDPSFWQFIAGQDATEVQLAAVKQEIKARLEPIARLYASAGGIRIESDDAAAAFLFILRGASSTAALGPLAELTLEARKFAELPSALITISGSADTGDARVACESLRHCGPLNLPWEATDTPAPRPKSGEGLAEWLERVALSPEAVSRLLTRWELCGHDPELFACIGSRHERAGGHEKTEWLVPGLIARGGVTTLVGEGGVGKSTLAQALVHALGSVETVTPRPREFLGQPLGGGCTPLFISGEDAKGRFNEREEAFEKSWGESQILHLDARSKTNAEVLALANRVAKLDLVVIDSSRRFMEGDEDSSAIVSRFYDAWATLAAERNCAILLLHHLTKGRPNGLSAMLPMVRGSSVHKDRPRMLLGMLNRGNGMVDFGILKHNLDERELWRPVNEAVRFIQDPETLVLRPIAQRQPTPATGTSPPDCRPAVLAAIAAENAAGRAVYRTGKSELKALGLPALADFSREAIRSAVAELTVAGELLSTDAGIIVAPRSDPP